MPRVAAALKALAYPRTRRVGGRRVRFRLMTTVDREMLLAFARALPAEDLLFLRLDITRDEGVDEWCRNIIARRTLTVLAERDGDLVGYGSVHHNDLLWTAHLGRDPHPGGGASRAAPASAARWPRRCSRWAVT